MDENILFQKIREIKEKPYGSVTVEGFIKKTPVLLTAVSRDCVNDPHIIGLLSRWRKKHEAWFPAQFPVNE